MTFLGRMEYLKEKVFAMSNEDCFIERERFLSTVSDRDNKSSDYYANLVAGILEYVSTPVDEQDIFVGRVVEGAPEGDKECPNKIIFAKGHLTPNYHRLVTQGYRGVLEEIQKNADAIHTEQAENYAKNAEIVVNAIRKFALRYAEAAKECGNQRVYEALLKVPYEPAYDLYSALQGIWLVHMIASCYVGSRDYAFGYMDEYLYPYYQIEKQKGTTDDEIRQMLAGFFVKANEICGRHTHNYKKKPILSQASKQYVLLDGGRANEFTEIILDAAKINCMAQPQFTVVLSETSSETFKDKVYDTMTVMTDKLHIYNCELLKDFLKNKNLPEELIERPGFSACCTADIYQHSCREEFYLPTVQLFCDTLQNKKFASKADFTKAYSESVSAACKAYLEETRTPDYDWARCVFVMDCLLLGTCNERCEYPPYALEYRAKNIFLPGLATLGDSLCALDKMVFQGEMSYGAFIDMLKADFVGYEEIEKTISELPKFGNNYEEDHYTVEMAHLLIDAVENVPHETNEIVLPSFYSLERDNTSSADIPATPDGRKAGKPFSENQSPVYGADKNGITSLLNSLSKIPFGKTAAGGLNLTFSSTVKADVLKALVKTYFEQGGLHVGISVIDRATLLDAMKRPEKYKTLTVRLYGFSEYFISLPEWQQIAVLNRTAY